MTNYVKSTNFASKDSLATGNPLKIVKGTEIDTEFNNIATAISTKSDSTSPTFSTGVTLDYMTANQVPYIGASKELTGSSLLTFDGSTFTATANMLLKKTANTANTYSQVSFKVGYTPTGLVNSNTNGSVLFYSKDQAGNEGVSGTIKNFTTTASGTSTIALGKIYLIAHKNTAGTESSKSYLYLETGSVSTLYGESGLKYDVGSGWTHSWRINGTEKLKLDDLGTFTVKDLAGTGTRPVYANDAGELTTATAQTWQDVKASRVSGTTYTNNTGQDIMVAVAGSASSGSPRVTIVVGGVTVADFSFPYGDIPFSFIVPDNTTYVVTFGAGTSIDTWAELR